MKKKIVFDMGNVLISYKPKEMIEKYTDDVEAQQILFKEIFHSIDWLKFDRGTIKKDELKRIVCNRIPNELEETAKTILDNWYNDVHPILEMKPIVEQLARKGHELYILSNVSVDFHQFKDKIPGFDLFQGVFISSDWKMIKPELDIYRAFYAHFQLNPVDCFFIDDMPLNIESASNTGMKGFIFQNNFEELRNVLLLNEQ
ncbi:HAD family hydrolase [Enterococcus sp. LJL99]